MAEEFRFRSVRTRPDYDACVLLQRDVWALSDLEITSAIQLIATVHAGGMIQIAETAQGAVPVGFCYAFPALRRGLPHLHSDMLAVRHEHRKRGLGLQLKRAQREEALARGIKIVTWTFDPLQARNASLNLRRLGASGIEFLENMYGVTTSSLHHGLPTDRLFVRWDLDSPRVRELAGQGEPPRTALMPTLPRINEVKWQAGWPVSSEPVLNLDAPQLVLEIPPEWDVLCQAAPRVAEGWHTKVRQALKTYLGRGYAAADFLPAQEGGRRRPMYVLRKA